MTFNDIFYKYRYWEFKKITYICTLKHIIYN